MLEKDTDTGFRRKVTQWRARNRLILFLVGFAFLITVFISLGNNYYKSPNNLKSIYSRWPLIITQNLFKYPKFGVLENEFMDLNLYIKNMYLVAFAGNFILLEILYFLLGFQILKRYEKRRPLRFLPCPLCDKSVKIYEDWQCDRCNNFQGTEIYISDKCAHCNRNLNTAYCEHCHGEIIL